MKHLNKFEALTEKEEKRLKSLKSELAITTSWVKYDKIEDQIKELEEKKESDEEINEAKDMDSIINEKVNKLSERLNKFTDIDAEVTHKAQGNTIFIKAELSFHKNLKKLTFQALSTICGEFRGYIEELEYKDNKNKLIIMFKTFEHNLK